MVHTSPASTAVLSDPVLVRPLLIVRGFVLLGLVAVLSMLGAAAAVVILVGLVRRRRLTWGPALGALALIVVAGSVAGVALARSGLRRAGQGAEVATEAGRSVAAGAGDVADAAGDIVDDPVQAYLDSRPPDERGCRGSSIWNGPEEELERVLCLTLPDETSQVWWEDTYLLGSGHEELVLDVDPATVAGWAAGPAPWGRTWEVGGAVDLPDDIDLGGADAGWPPPVGGEGLVSAGASSSHTYDDGTVSTFDWYLVLDTVGGRIWYASTGTTPLN